jgi:hypothetical protein
MLGPGQRKLRDLAEAVQRVDDADRQAIALALAVLAAERPGWREYMGDIASRLAMHDLFRAFADMHDESAGDWVPHKGDLCYVKDGDYYALVKSIQENTVTVRVSNGTVQDINKGDLLPVWISEQGACSNFCEEMPST